MTLVKLNIWIRTNRREQEREEKSWNPILALLTTICRPFIRLGLMFKIFLKSICLEVSISYLKYDNLHKVGKKIPILWFWKFYDFCIGKPETLAKGFGNRTFLRPNLDMLYTAVDTGSVVYKILYTALYNISRCRVQSRYCHDSHPYQGCTKRVFSLEKINRLHTANLWCFRKGL